MFRFGFLIGLFAISASLLAQTAPQPSVSIVFRDAPGQERQYRTSLTVKYDYEQLLDDFSGGTKWVTDAWTASETVASVKDDLAKMQYRILDGKRGMKFPGRLQFIGLPSDLPQEHFAPATAEFFRDTRGSVSEPRVLTGKLPGEHLLTPYGPFFALLMPFGRDLRLPKEALTVGQQWEREIEVPLMAANLKGASLQKVKRLVTFTGPQTVDGTRYQVFTVTIDTGDVECKAVQKPSGRKVTIAGTYRLNGKATLYFDEQAGAFDKVVMDGTCSSNTTVSSSRKSDGTGYEKVTAAFSGSTTRVPAGTPATP